MSKSCLIEKYCKPHKAIENLLYLETNTEASISSDENIKLLNDLEPSEITNAKNINKLVEIVNRNSETSEKNAKTANTLSLTAIIISIFSISVSIYLSKQPIKLNEQQFDKLLNKINSNTVSISQIVNYAEPSKTSKVTISRKLIRKNKR